MDDPPSEYESKQIDLAGVDLHELSSVDSPVLADALRRLVAEFQEAQPPTAGFSSSI